MSERAAFLEAIRADPDSDAPRLVYADWLDDHGEGLRAALIRFQVAAHEPGESDQGLYLPRLAKRLGVPAASLGQFKRGFIDRLDVGEPDMLKCLPKFLEVEPGLHRMARFRWRTQRPGLAEVVADADSLNFDLVSGAKGPLRPDRSFRCRRLSIFGNEPPPAGLELPRLRHLSTVYVTPPEVQRLLDSAPELRSADVAFEPGQGSTGTEARGMRWPSSIAEFNLSRWDLSAALVFVESRAAPNLRRVSLTASESPGDLALLARWPEQIGVTDLSLTGLTTARASPRSITARVESLHVSPGEAAFRGRPPLDPAAWPRLRRLRLSGHSDQILEMSRAFSRIMSGVESFQLNHMPPGFFDGEAWQRPGRLRRLTMDTIDPKELARASLLAALAGLEFLKLNAYGHSASTVNAIARAPFGRNLRALTLGRQPGNKAIDAAVIDKFGPRCDLFWRIEEAA